MAEIDRIKRAIKDSNELSKLGKKQEALELLDEWLAEAIRENQVRSVRILSRHAATISESMGDLARARHYFEQSLVYDPNDALALYGLADIVFRQGEMDLARQYAVKCYKLSMQRDTELDHLVIEMITKQWPEINTDKNSH